MAFQFSFRVRLPIPGASPPKLAVARFIGAYEHPNLTLWNANRGDAPQELIRKGIPEITSTKDVADQDRYELFSRGCTFQDLVRGVHTQYLGPPPVISSPEDLTQPATVLPPNVPAADGDLVRWIAREPYLLESSPEWRRGFIELLDSAWRSANATAQRDATRALRHLFPRRPGGAKAVLPPSEVRNLFELTHCLANHLSDKWRRALRLSDRSAMVRTRQLRAIGRRQRSAILGKVDARSIHLSDRMMETLLLSPRQFAVTTVAAALGLSARKLEHLRSLEEFRSQLRSPEKLHSQTQ